MGDYDDIFGVQTEDQNSNQAVPEYSSPEYDKIFTPKRTFLGTAKDVGISALKGAVGLGESAVGLANLATGGLVGKGLDAVGYDPNATTKILDEQLSPAQQVANDKVQKARGFIDTAKTMIQNPSTIGHSIVESLPATVAGGMVGGASAGVVSKALPKLATGALEAIGAGFGEGITQAGSAIEQNRQADAKKELTTKGVVTGIASGVGTGVIGAVGGKLAAKLGVEDPDVLFSRFGRKPSIASEAINNATTEAEKKGVAGFLARILGGGISEGVFEELPQSMQEQIWQNIAQDKPLLEGVPEAGAQGLLTGAAMGGGANIIHRNNSEVQPSDGAVTKALASMDIGRRSFFGQEYLNNPPVETINQDDAEISKGERDASRYVARSNQQNNIRQFSAPAVSMTEDAQGILDGKVKANDLLYQHYAPEAPVGRGGEPKVSESQQQSSSNDDMYQQYNPEVPEKRSVKPAADNSFRKLSANTQAGTVEPVASEFVKQQEESSAYRKERNKASEPVVIDNTDSIAHGHEVNVSPTPAQAEAGNYKKAHVNVDGIDISVENPSGSTRTGTDATGRTWETTMASDYGYIKGSVGKDKDHVDIFVKPGYQGGAENVYVVNQHNDKGDFDEHKAVIGVSSKEEAIAEYKKNYEEGWSGGKSVVAMPIDQFKEWVKSGEPKKGPAVESSVSSNGNTETQTNLPVTNDTQNASVSDGSNQEQTSNTAEVQNWQKETLLNSDESPAPDVTKNQEQDNIVEHITKKGKKLQGVIRKDITYQQAKAIDPYTFKKDGGFFIRLQHVTDTQINTDRDNDKPTTNNKPKNEDVKSVTSQETVNNDTVNSETNTQTNADQNTSQDRQEIAESDTAKESESVAKEIESSPAESGKAERELASMSDDDIDSLINEVSDNHAKKQTAQESPTLPAEQRTPEKSGEVIATTQRPGQKSKPTIATPAKLAVEGMDEILKGIGAAFGVSPNKLISFPPTLDRDTYAKARPHFEAGWKKMNEAGKSLKEYIQFLFDSFGDVIPKFKEYVSYFVKELQGKENFAEDTASNEKPETKVETEQDQDTTTDSTENTGTGDKRKPRRTKDEIDQDKKDREQRKIDRDEERKKKAEEEARLLAEKANKANFQNVGYVFDPEKLRNETQGKSPKSAVVKILDSMVPSKVWSGTIADDATPGLRRMFKNIQDKNFQTFKEYIRQTSFTTAAQIEAMYGESQETIDSLINHATTYMESLKPLITAMSESRNIQDAVTRIQDTLFSGAKNEDGTWTDKPSAFVYNSKGHLLNSKIFTGYISGFFRLVTADWTNLLADENDTLLSEINAHKRPRNANVIRTGLPEYNQKLKKTEDFQEPFGFKGVGFGEEGWINQEERERVINAAFNSFKDMAATIGANDKGMSLGGKLAVQFANLGHLSKGAAAAYFPSQKTINFTRDNGDGTLAHEWGHALDYLIDDSKASHEIRSAISHMKYAYDFDAGMRLVDDLLSKESPLLKRIISSKKRNRIEAVKEEVRQNYESVVKKETHYYETAQMIDKDYTARDTEMWARAFETYVYDKLPGRNNYLVSDYVGEGRVGGKAAQTSRLVYPAGAERTYINSIIDQLIKGLQWDDSGKATLKEGYQKISDTMQQRMDEEMNKLLDQVEDRYNAIWSSEPSPDGNYWYQYNVTAFGPMMQPDGYVAYDKKFKAEGQSGVGVVAFASQLHPDDILDFKLQNVQYESDGAVYISQNKEGLDYESDSMGESREETLGEVSTGKDGRPKERGDVRDGSGESGANGERGRSANGEQGNETGDGEGTGDEGIHSTAARNFRITDDTLTDSRSVDSRFFDNISALRTLALIESEDRSPTLTEKEVLSKYSGWGGMGEVFSWNPQGAWKDRREVMLSVLDENDIPGAERSAVTSYYTPVPVARFMWQLAQRLGFDRGAVLDPSLGASGVFFGTLPADLEQTTSLNAVEIDQLSARIASKLYEASTIETNGFQDSSKPSNKFDIAITNVPFSKTVYFDKRHNKGGYQTHNYFINKMINLTSPGGLTFAITSSSTMDNVGDHLKEYAEKADLVGAIRLPSGIYSATNVTTDILVFRKKITGSKYTGVPVNEWTTSGKHKATGLEINNYFINHPDMVAGNLESVRGRFGDDSVRVVNTEDLGSVLNRISDMFPGDIVERVVKNTETDIDSIIDAPGTVKEGGIYITSTKGIAWKIDGQEIVMSEKTPADKKKANIARGYVKILDAVRNTIRLQKTEASNADVLKSQKDLLKAYNEFVKNHGPVNKAKNAEVFLDDPDSSWVIALEEYDADRDTVTKLADIFTKNVTGKIEAPTRADNAHDALSISLNEYGYPNIDYMAGLVGKSSEEIMKEIGDKIVENPETGFLEPIDEYLSGNIKAKLDVAKTMAQNHPEYERNVKLLEAAMPEPIPPHRITARLGASWIKPSHIADFIIDKLNMDTDYLRPIVTFDKIVQDWKLTFKGSESFYKGEVKAETKREISRYANSVESTKTWGTRRLNFFDLVELALSGKKPTVIDRESGALDIASTQAAEAKTAAIQAEFARWLFSENNRAEEAAQRFNAVMNTSVPPVSNGSHLTFPGKSLAVLTEKEKNQLGVTDKMAFYAHQVNAVWKYLRHGNQYLAHEVGAGKTITMALAAMEAKRLRGKKKVLYVTMNDSTLGQAVAEIKKLYPVANVMPIMVSTKKERQRVQLQRMAMNNFDIAVMRQQDLDRISLSPSAEAVFINEELTELREYLEIAKKEGKRISEREIQARIEERQEKLKAASVYDEAKKENLYFDDLGVDLMIVDEAHAYKNVPYATVMDNVTGMNPAGSKTAHAFFMKTRYLNAQFPKNDSLILASGTPLTNSIAEMFNIQRFLQPAEMKRQGVWNFDRWIATYGDIGTDFEYDGARGTYKAITVNRRIVNAGRLLATAYQNIDSVRAKDTSIARPEIRGGKPIAVEVDPNKYVDDYSRIILERSKAYDSNPAEAEYLGRPDNMLRMISDMSAVAIDQRMNPMYSGTKIQEDSKIYKASRIIYGRWKEETKNKGVQLVFTERRNGSFEEKTNEELEAMSEQDREQYLQDVDKKRKQTFDVYEELTSELVKLGIPRNQIAFIHDADHSNKKKKEANLRSLFKKVNDGDIRVLIGSTPKLGTGVNVQKRVSDVHHLDVWWNYSAWEQRNGRAIRAGNIYEKLGGVGIYNYITKKTVDATRWDKIFMKGKVMNAVMGGDINLDFIEDITQETLSAKEMAAIAADNPLMAEYAKLLNSVQNLKHENSAYLSSIRDAKKEIAIIPSRIDTSKFMIDQADKTISSLSGVTAVSINGGQIFDISKEGKELSEAIGKIIAKDTSGWQQKTEHNLLVFGTYVEGAGKKGEREKGRKFIPINVTANLTNSPGDPLSRVLKIVGPGILGTNHTIADIDKDKKVKITSSINAMVSSCIRKAEDTKETNEKIIAKSTADIKKLEEFVKVPWPKAAQLATDETRMEEVGKAISMSVAGKTGNPETGMKIEDFRGPAPVMDDLSDRDNWTDYDGYIANSDGSAVFLMPVEDMGRMFYNVRKKFTPYSTYSSRTSRALQDMLSKLDDVNAKPVAFTTINGSTKIWVKANLYITPEQWGMASRVAGKDATWRLSAPISSGTSSVQYLVGKAAGSQNVAMVRVEKDTDMPEGVEKFFNDTTQYSQTSEHISEHANIEQELTDKLGQSRTTRLISRGLVKILDTQESIKRIIADVNSAIKYAKDGKTIQGAYVDGQVYLVRDGLEKGQAYPALLHEFGEHAAQLGFTKDEEYQSILDSLERRKNQQNKTGKAIRDAIARVPKDTAPEHYWSEVAAYLVENDANEKLSIVDRIKNFFKKILFKIGVTSADIFTHQDIVMFAQAAIRAATGGNAVQRAMLSVHNKESNFSKWFKKSQVVDDQGEPLTVYHGSPTFGKESYAFEYRDNDQAKTVSPGAGLGFFFAEERNDSLPYSGPDGNITAVNLSIQNPLRINSFDLPRFANRAEAAAFRKRKQLQGYDGIYLKDEGHWIAFESGQIKSATDNVGTYNAVNPDIRYSVASGSPTYRVAGTKFTDLYRDRETMAKIKKGTVVNLVHDPGNEHDVHAVRIEFDGKHIGYIQKHQSAEISKMIDNGLSKARISKVLGDSESPTFRISLVDSASTQQPRKKYTSKNSASSIQKALNDIENDVVERVSQSGPTSENSQAVSETVSTPATNDDGVWSRVTDQVKSLPETLRRTALGSYTLQQLDKVYGNELPSMHDYYEATRGMTARANRIMTAGEQVYTKWSKISKKQNELLADIMGESTMLGVDPSLENFEARENIQDLEDKKQMLADKLVSAQRDFREASLDMMDELDAKVQRYTRRIAAINKQIATEKNRATKYEGLRQRFLAMDKTSQEIFTDVRDSYVKNLKSLRASLIARLERTVTNEKAKKTAADALRVRFDQYIKSGPYFPMARFGKYVVVLTAQNGEREVHSFDFVGEKNRYVNQWSQEKNQDGSTKWTIKQMTSKDYTPQLDGASLEFVTKVMNAIGQADGITSAVKNQLSDEVNQLFIKAMPDMSHRKHFVHRKKVEGYSRDQIRAFASNIQHAAHHIARINYADKMNAAIKAIEETAKEAKEGNVGFVTDLYNELNKRNDMILNPKISPVAQAITSVGFLWNIGPSIASAMVNLSQTPLVSFPMLAARYGFRKTFKAITEATKMYFSSPWNIDRGFDLTNHPGLSGDEKGMFKNLIDGGTIDVTQAMAIAQASGADFFRMARTKQGNTMLKVMRALAYPFHITELANRKVTALAAYRLAKAANQTHGDAINSTRDMVDDSHFVYASSNRARYMEGNVQRVLLLFKQYSQQMTFLLGHSLVQAVKGETQDVKDIARKQLAGIVGGHFIVSGLFGMPVLGFAADVLQTLFSAMGGGDKDDPEDWEVMIRNWLADMFGNEGGSAISHGLWRLIPGLGQLDVSSRMSLGDLWFRSPDREAEGQDKFNQWINLLLGPIASDSAAVFQGLNTIAGGDAMRGIEMMLPKALKDMLKTVRYGEKGVTSWNNATLIKDLSAMELSGQLLGFTPTRVSEMYEGKNAVKNLEKRLQKRRERLINKWVSAYKEQDMETASAVRDEISAFNSVNHAFRITGDTLRKSMQAKNKVQAMTSKGVYLPKNKRALMDEGRFSDL